MRGWVVITAMVGSISARELIDYVNPFIGTEGSVPGTAYNGGNTFPGAVVPFGSVKIGPDTTSFNSSIGQNAGYTPDGNVTAFSLTHVSGTGGGPVYGVVSQMPLLSMDGVNVVDNLTYMEPRDGNDTASVGYYRSRFANGIITELSATSHTGFLQYSFPAGSERHILVDVSHYLPSVGGGNQAQWYSNGDIQLSGDGSMYTGSGVYRGAFSHIPAYQVYFCGKFDQVPTSSRLFTAPYTDPYWPHSVGAEPAFTDATSVRGGPAYYSYGRRVGSVFAFANSVSTLKSKIGISFTSSEKACQYLEDEVPHWNLKAIEKEARTAWSQTLEAISIQDKSNDTRLEMFYTGMYHAHLMPTDRTGDNANWETSEPSYDDYYTLWDTFRCLNSLYLLIAPDRAIGMIKSLIDIWRHEQFMPDGRSGNANGQVQGGSNSDNVLADAYVKGLRGGINWTEGYLAMKTNAELTPWNNWDTGDPISSTIQGRGALPDWIEYGYLTPYYDRSVSRTVEYALNDFSVAQVAKGVAPDEYEKYLKRSAGWQYQWDANLESLNFTGFIAPLYADGSRDPDYNPAVCPGYCEFGGYTYEALGYEYTWTIPFDMTTLIDRMGGTKKTEERLDIMFKAGLRKGGVGNGGLNGAGTTLFNPGNEPSFATPFLYNYLPGRQHKSVLRSRQTINTYYNNGRSGLPGNSDAGALDSYMMWQMMGLYPVATQPVYLILSPWFAEYEMKVGTQGETLKVTAHGLSDASYYVQSLKVNGKTWNKSWIDHDQIANGGTLEFFLGSKATSWDSEEVPPSPGHYSLDN
jgi:predicted alpha-1,2-mannosidase